MFRFVDAKELQRIQLFIVARIESIQFSSKLAQANPCKDYLNRALDLSSPIWGMAWCLLNHRLDELELSGALGG